MPERNKNGDELPLATMKMQELDAKGAKDEVTEGEVAEAYRKVRGAETLPIRFVDHVDRLRPEPGMPRERLKAIYDELKSFAKEMNVPIVIPLQTPQMEHRHWRQEFNCYPSHRSFETMKTVDLYAADGAHMGKARLETCGRWTVLDKWNDIVLKQGYWFLAGQFDGDPTVAFGLVERFQLEHCRDWVKPRTTIWLRLRNGHLAKCYDTDIHKSKEAAEQARLQQLREEQHDDTDTRRDE